MGTHALPQAQAAWATHLCKRVTAQGAGHTAAHSCRSYVKSKHCSLSQTSYGESFFGQDASWREVEWKSFYTLCYFCKDKLGREKAQEEYLKVQAYLFETQKAVAYVTQYAWTRFSKTPFPLGKEALHKTEGICVGSLGLITD